MAAAGTYSAQLVVTDNTGATDSTSHTIVVSAQAAPPAAPTNLTGSATSARLVTLNWTDNATTETGFSVERSAKARRCSSRGSPPSPDGRTYSRTETSGQWVYRVQAYNATGVSGYSNSVTVRAR